MALILIIDDKAGRGHCLGTVLHQAGYQTRIIDSPALALVALEDQPQPHLILLSDDLPRTPEGPFCRRLKALYRMPVLLYSDELRLSSEAYVQALGADYTLTYPFTRQCLIKQVAAALQSPLSSKKQVG